MLRTTTSSRPSGATKHWKKHSESRLSYLSAHLLVLSSHSFSSLIFMLRLFSCLTLPTSAFPYVHIVGSLTCKLLSMAIHTGFEQPCFQSTCYISDIIRPELVFKALTASSQPLNAATSEGLRSLAHRWQKGMNVFDLVICIKQWLRKVVWSVCSL